MLREIYRSTSGHNLLWINQTTHVSLWDWDTSRLSLMRATHCRLKHLRLPVWIRNTQAFCSLLHQCRVRIPIKWLRFISLNLSWSFSSSSEFPPQDAWGVSEQIVQTLRRLSTPAKTDGLDERVSDEYQSVELHSHLDWASQIDSRCSKVFGSTETKRWGLCYNVWRPLSTAQCRCPQVKMHYLPAAGCLRPWYKRKVASCGLFLLQRHFNDLILKKKKSHQKRSIDARVKYLHYKICSCLKGGEEGGALDWWI